MCLFNPLWYIHIVQWEGFTIAMGWRPHHSCGWGYFCFLILVLYPKFRDDSITAFICFPSFNDGRLFQGNQKRSFKEYKKRAGGLHVVLGTSYPFLTLDYTNLKTYIVGFDFLLSNTNPSTLYHWDPEWSLHLVLPPPLSPYLWKECSISKANLKLLTKIYYGFSCFLWILLHLVNAKLATVPR